MKAYLTRRYWFSASHRLHCESMSGEENRAVYGKCNNPYGHGHNYALEITVGGQVEPSTGMVCNLADLDKFVQEKILERFDHQNLNTLFEFQGVVPTTENLCVEVYGILEKDFHFARVEKIRVEETMLNSFEYAGGREIRY
ncbi:MAG: 6-carboxytetrahydropterin synthase [Candidatus Angelobacter sp.]